MYEQDSGKVFLTQRRNDATKGIKALRRASLREME